MDGGREKSRMCCAWWSCAFQLGRLGPTTGFGLIALGLWVPSDLEPPGRGSGSHTANSQ